MSQQYAWGAMWLGREATSRRELAACVASDAACEMRVLSQLPQAFDLFVFAALALTVFPEVFLPMLGPGVGVGAVAVWALAYLIAWPVRAALVRLDDSWHPLLRLALARILFAGSTLAVAALPDANHVAWAPLLLILARIGQGLALGGLAHGRLGKATPAEEQRQGMKSWIFAGAIGFTAGAVTLGVFAVTLQRGDVLAWAWRYPFVIAPVLNMAAGFADFRLARARCDRSAEGRPPLRLVAVRGARLD